MNNIFSPSSELNNLKLERLRHHHRWLSQRVTVTRHDGRHKDAPLKVTESDSPPDTLNHHKVIQGQSGGPESGHHDGGLSAFSPSQHPQYRPHPLIILDGYLLVYPRCCLVTPPPHVWCVSASLQSDLVTSLSLRSLVSTHRHNHTSSHSQLQQSITLTRSPDNIGKVTQQTTQITLWKVHNFCDALLTILTILVKSLTVPCPDEVDSINKVIHMSQSINNIYSQHQLCLNYLNWNNLEQHQRLFLPRTCWFPVTMSILIPSAWLVAAHF